MAGVRVARLGGSSVRYEVGIFQGADETACAQGHFIHVYVTAPPAGPCRCRKRSAPRWRRSRCDAGSACTT